MWLVDSISLPIVYALNVVYALLTNVYKKRFAGSAPLLKSG